MANRKQSFDLNAGAALAVRKATGTKKQKGEDLIGDPKLKAAFKEAKRRSKK